MPVQGDTGQPQASHGAIQGFQPGSPAAELARQQAAEKAAEAATALPPPTMARAIGGLAAGAVIAFFFCMIWLVVELFAGGRLGVLACALGGLVGLVSGSIAKTPSKGFAAATAVLTLIAILLTKLIMAGGVMLAAKGMSMAGNMMFYSTETQKQLHALADDMLDQGLFEGDHEEFAKAYTEAYFRGNEDDYGEGLSEEAIQLEEEFVADLHRDLKAMAPEDRKIMMDGVRERHPLWIENPNHFFVMLDVMMNEPDLLTPPQKDFARAQLSFINENKYGSTYYEVTDAAQIHTTQTEVRQLAGERFVEMDKAAVDLTMRQIMKMHPHWNPLPDATVAMTAKMLNDGEFQNPLKEQVSASLSTQLTPDEMSSDGYFDSTDWAVTEQRQKEIGKLVVARLVEFDQEQRDVLVADTLEKNPSWIREKMSDEERMAIASSQLGEIGDGTLMSSLGVVLGPLDCLWILLAGVSAFGTVRKLGSA